MLGRYYELTNALPPDYNDHMVAMRGFSDQYLLPAAFRAAHPNKISYHGYLSRENAKMAEEITKYLNVAQPVPVRVDFKPSTVAWEQHWVLLIGEKDNDYEMIDPWTGRIGLLSEVYNIPGVDVLEAIFYKLL